MSLFPRVPLFFQPCCEMSHKMNFTTKLILYQENVEQFHQISQLFIQYSPETKELSLSELLSTVSTGPDFQMLHK